MKRLLNKRAFDKTYLVVGLGNPGAAYEKTRHNVGFLCLERFCHNRKGSLKKKLFAPLEQGEVVLGETRFILAKPLTYMNRSGQVLPALIRKYGITPERMVVVVDNMDLEPGGCRIKLKGSSAGHNGLKSVIGESGSAAFVRLFIGVGRPAAGVSVVDHVLGTPSDAEASAFQTGIDRAVRALELLAEKAPDRVMNEINRKQSD